MRRIKTDSHNDSRIPNRTNSEAATDNTWAKLHRCNKTDRTWMSSVELLAAEDWLVCSHLAWYSLYKRTGDYSSLFGNCGRSQYPPLLYFSKSLSVHQGIVCCLKSPVLLYSHLLRVAFRYVQCWKFDFWVEFYFSTFYKVDITIL